MEHAEGTNEIQVILDEAVIFDEPVGKLETGHAEILSWNELIAF